MPSTAPNGPVILFHDTWVNYNETGIGKAMVRVLEAAGYEVLFAEGRKCCGRPLITGGQADKAKPWIDHNVALLAPLAHQGIPIVGIEPSCILTLRDEYLDLASRHQARPHLGVAGLHLRGVCRARGRRGALPAARGPAEPAKHCCTATVITRRWWATKAPSPRCKAAGYDGGGHPQRLLRHGGRLRL